MGYAQGVRYGHAGGHLREPVLELVEALRWDPERWWDVADVEGEPFQSPGAAYDFLGRLWHCTDIVPSSTRTIALSMLGEDRLVTTYAQLVRELRQYIASRRVSA